MKIPSSLRIKKDISYQIVWQDIIRDDETLQGYCEPNERIIYLSTKQSKTSVVKTFIHEAIHAVEFEYDTPIPHKITNMLEEGLYRILKLNGWLK